MSLMRTNRNSLFPTFNGMLDDFFGREFFEMDRATNSHPAVNIKEEEGAYTVEMAAPGLEKDDFKVEVHGNALTISSRKEEKTEEKDESGKYTRREFRYHSFSRAFTLPDTVNAEGIEAKYESGVLHVSLPKREEVLDKGPKMIEIA